MVSMRGVMPTVGQELMPPMDTGGVKISIVTDPNLPIEASRRIVEKVNTILEENGPLLRLSSANGSEPGVLSIGSGSGIDNIAITATYVNRYEREETIWEIEHRLRPLLAEIDNIKSLEVVDYGATAMASIRASVDVTLFSPSFVDLERAGDLVEQALYKTKGLVSVARSWHNDKTVYNLEIDPYNLV